MTALYYFYPENDLALARNIARYTAPPAAVKLRRAGATLPLFYGEPGGEVLADGINAPWLGRLRDSLGIDCSPYTHRPQECVPAPWGWSKASRQTFIDIGFDRAALPDDAALEAIRQLSHRRSSARIAEALTDTIGCTIAPPARELFTTEDIKSFIASHPAGTVLKLPWSSSGRGLVATDPVTAQSQTSMFEGMLRRQRSVMAEPRMHKLLDFAMLFTIADGKCCFDGYSVFENVQFGSYAGNMLAPQAELRRKVATLCGEGTLTAIETALPAILENLTGTAYSGPLGIDMMAVDEADYIIAPAVELNLRMTMGHLCRIFYERHVADGASGTFRVLPASQDTPTGIFDAAVRNGRIHGGRVDMAQPGCDFSFIADIK